MTVPVSQATGLVGDTSVWRVNAMCLPGEEPLSRGGSKPDQVPLHDLEAIS